MADRPHRLPPAVRGDLQPGRGDADRPLVEGLGGEAPEATPVEDQWRTGTALHLQEALALTFARRGADKFAGVGRSPGATGAPRLHGALARIDATVEDVHEAGDHFLVTARVMEVESGAGTPLVFYRGGFGGFAP